MNSFLSYEIILEDTENKLLYSDLEKQLFNINEKQTQRKEKGVYYTDNDVTEFIIDECITNRDKTTFLAGSIFDPTCGSGEFLLTALKKKVTINNTLDVKWEIKDIIKTIYGNDLNPESISITKLRLFLFILNEYGIKSINNIGKILNKNFSSEDFLSYSNTCKYDFIIGNPPYVETRGTTVFGNLYADVLNNVCNYSSDNGVIGFIIPLSYISTPRMNKIRSRISEIYNSQYLYNYADRPGCLFTQVHQKLTILIACKTKEKQISTGNYQYWYNEEREELFKNKKIITNPFGNEKFIPKLGTIEDKTVYENVELALRVVGENPKNIRPKVMEVLERVGVAHKYKKYPDELSGGECQRVGIARAIVNNPSIIIADECTGNLDIDNSRSIMKLLDGINKQGITVIMATHNLDLVKEFPR